MAWDVVVRREVEPLIDALKGKRAGYVLAERQLERDPCVEFPGPDGSTRPFAYRLSGPLAPTGLRRPPQKRVPARLYDATPCSADFEGIVDILFVGTRDTRDRSQDTWQIVHDLFGEENPPDEHLRPPCCGDGLPEIGPDELEEFMTRLRRFLR